MSENKSDRKLLPSADGMTAAEGDRDEAIARAERAEAKVARVEHLIHNATSGSKPAGLTLANGARFGLVSTVDLSNAIFDNPAFTLPTSAGARFTAQGKYDAIGRRTTFITLVGGREPAYVVADKEEDILYHAHGVMEHYTDHRHEDAK